MSNLALSPSDIDYLLSPKAIRDRATQIFALTEQGKTHFVYHPEKFTPTVFYVLSVIKKNYPDLNIPFHSRWGHFRVGKVDRVAALDKRLGSLAPMERARTKLDLVIASVLLDAGAGMTWSYLEKDTQQKFSRSEGLGVASLHMFLAGCFAEDQRSLRADSRGLQKVGAKLIEEHFQVSDANPLVGVAGRALLLNNLGKALENKKIFRDGRPGNIVDYLVEKYGKTVPAVGVLRAVLDGLGPIWPGRLNTNGINLGDVWQYPALGAEGSLASLVPFHKLSQWLTYSLLEPIMDAGITITGVENLTGLAEYRNGGLLLDSGLVSLKDPNEATQTWTPDSALIIEWRALTIYLLDLIGAAVQKTLGKSQAEFPLAKVLEGGTWWAGRFLAQEKRKDGGPPLQIKSDGTVF